MKTAVSLPDEVFEGAEKLARRLKISRSELYGRALREFLSRHAPDEVTASWDAVVDEVDPPDEVGGSARAVFEQVEW
jgi:metal-responsive CopG/Arc/MetJ family transcriptional regulator